MKKISFNDYIPEELSDNESCRLITTEQYQEYLKLKEEHKPISWKELKEEAKKMGYEVKKDTVWCQKYFTGELFTLDGITFTENGTIFIDGYGNVVAYDRTPDQMLAIMKALQ